MYTTHATYHPTKMREQIHATMKVNSSKTVHYIKLKLKLQIDKVLIEMYEKSHFDIFNRWRLPIEIAATIRKSQAKCSVAAHGCLREKFISDKLQPVCSLYIRFLEFLKNFYPFTNYAISYLNYVNLIDCRPIFSRFFRQLGRPIRFLDPLICPTLKNEALLSN